MSSQQHSVDNDGIVSHMTIVCNMRRSHDKTIIANLGLARCDGSPVDGHAFANGAIVANYCQRILSAKF